MNKRKFNFTNFVIVTCLILWGFLIFYPFYNSILVSFMTQGEYMRKSFALFVENPTLIAYREIFSDNKFFYGYKNTLIYLGVRLPFEVLFVSMAGYALSRKPYFLSKTINNLAVVTMYFSGGIIPLYLTIKSYGLMGSLASLILTGIISVYNMTLVKKFFYGISDSLEESAKLDGANDIRIFFQIYLPLAKPIIATISLFTAVAIWNDWYYPMLFLSSTKKWPLQLVLKEIISTATAVTEEAAMSDEEVKETFALNMQMASVVVTMLPIMLVYPFLQKFFMKGLTVGAVKG